MTRVHHVSCGSLHAPPHPRAVCHGLILEDPRGLALVDPGIGLADGLDPLGRIGPDLVALAGFQFDPADTAVRRLEERGLSPADVAHVILTHADPDHAGAIADFPLARVHLSAVELDGVNRGNPRYRPAQFEHGPRWRAWDGFDRDWFGLPARSLDLGFSSEILLIRLHGHTLGHRGVAIGGGDHWRLHVGDAYYLRVELETDDHPVSQLAALRADDDDARRASLEELRRLDRDHSGQIEMFGYHDSAELPGG